MPASAGNTACRRRHRPAPAAPGLRHRLFFRLQAYADDGIAGTGPVPGGQLEWQQALGERTRLSQTTRVETGQHGTFRATACN